MVQRVLFGCCLAHLSLLVQLCVFLLYYILCIQYCQSRQELSENVFHGMSQGSLDRFKLGQLYHTASLLLENTYMGNGANKGYLCLLYLNAFVGNFVMGKAVPR